MFNAVWVSTQRLSVDRVCDYVVTTVGCMMTDWGQSEKRLINVLYPVMSSTIWGRSDSPQHCSCTINSIKFNCCKKSFV